MQPELLSLFYLINLTEKYVNSINPFDILKDNAKVKEFALVITNATAGYQNKILWRDKNADFKKDKRHNDKAENQ